VAVWFFSAPQPVVHVPVRDHVTDSEDVKCWISVTSTKAEAGLIVSTFSVKGFEWLNPAASVAVIVTT
jgi:hypothetical protein